MLKKLILTAAIIVTVAGGCEDKSPPVPEAAAPSGLPATLRLAAAPVDAKGVAEARSSATAGSRVTIRGVVGGRREPIAEGRALLTLLDLSVKTCDKTPGDACATPWDACCEPKELLVKNSLTVQVVDPEGRPLRASLTQVPGVKPLATLVVTGTVASASADSIAINADGIFVE